ncbi:MAG: hypothetical protein NC340_02505 [Ruminococcus flavefaciens]|nr:hypothetical protein [Ruminococcus flavefaciens]MCM1229345.1 hypothetical protein [Ruminococcus flavefaciens]
MKKLFSSVFILFAFCLASCSAPMQTTQSRQNNLDSAFSSEITLTLDKLTAEGTLKRYGDSEWEIEFLSPNTLSGVNLAFSQGNVNASYKGLSFSVPKSALPVKAMLVNLIEAVDTNARSEELKGSENEGMLEISGTLEGGDYLLTVDGNGNISSFDMPNNLLEINFNDIQAISGSPAPTEETTAVTAETTTSAESSSQATD